MSAGRALVHHADEESHFLPACCSRTIEKIHNKSIDCPFADVSSYRFGQTQIRTMAAISGEMFRQAVAVHPKGLEIMAPGTLVTDPINAISLGLARMFGTAGLPHILMRFFTVPDAKEARKSVFYATGFIVYFYILTFIIGFAAIMLLAQSSEFFKPEAIAANGTVIKDQLVTGLNGGTNMVAIRLTEAVGGLVGLISAVVLTILSKAVWGDVLGHTAMADGTEVAVGLIRLNNPAIVSMRLAFFSIWIVSLLDNSERAKQERLAFEAQKVRCETGIGAEGAASH